MSFADLERGDLPPLSLDTGINPEEDLKFQKLARQIRVQIHKINSNVAAVVKLVDLLGTKKDTRDLRERLHNLTEVTRALLKDSTTEFNDFAKIKLLPTDREHKIAQERVINDFRKSLQSFQTASKRSLERQRLFVQHSPSTSSSSAPPTTTTTPWSDLGPGEGPLLELEEQRQQGGQQVMEQEEEISDADLAFRESLIQEREEEIEQIEQGISELNQIFKDMGTLVEDQGILIDNIESNIQQTANDTQNASTQLIQAHEYQRRSNRRMFCLLLVGIVVIAFVLLAVLS